MGAWLRAWGIFLRPTGHTSAEQIDANVTVAAGNLAIVAILIGIVAILRLWS